jgi:hypothetical protein
VRARNLFRFPGSGDAERDGPREPTGPVRSLVNDFPLDPGLLDEGASDEGVFLGRQPIWLKLAGGAALLYGAYLVSWSSAEPAQRAIEPPVRGREIAVTAPPPTPAVAPAIDRPEPLTLPSPPPPPGARRLSNEELHEVPDQTAGARPRSRAGRRLARAADRIGGETLRDRQPTRAHRQHRPAPARTAAPRTLTRRAPTRTGAATYL